MSAGLHIYDASGNLILEVTDRLQRKIGEITIAAGASGSVTTDNGTPWFYIANNGSTANSGSEYTPIVSISGSTISYSPNTAAGLGQVDVTMIYGVY